MYLDLYYVEKEETLLQVVEKREKKRKIGILISSLFGK